MLSGPGQGGLFSRSGVGARLLCPFFSSSQDSKEGPPAGVPPPSRACCGERGEWRILPSRTGDSEAQAPESARPPTPAPAPLW